MVQNQLPVSLRMVRQVGAGPVEQGKDSHAYSCFYGPAMGGQQRKKLSLIGYFHQLSSLEVGHQNNRNDNFIGRKSQDKAGQDNSIHTEQTSGRIQEAGQIGQKADTAPFKISQQPYDQPCRSRYQESTPQNEQGAVQYRADNDFTELGFSVWGQLQRKGGRHSAQQCFRKNQRRKQRSSNSQQDQTCQKERGGERRRNRECSVFRCLKASHEKKRNQSD